MESAVATIIRLADEADLATHKKTLDTLRNLVFALERPGDTIQRLLYMVQLLCPSTHRWVAQ